MKDTLRCCLWHFHLCFCPTKEQIGFESAGAAPMLLHEAPPKTIKLVPYSPNISFKPPENVFFIPITCVVKGNAYRKAYIVDPRAAPQADSRVPEGEGDFGGIIPFWNAVLTVEGHTNLVLDSLTTVFGMTATVKNEGYKGVKPPVKLDIIFPILTNPDLIQAGNLIHGPFQTFNRLTAATAVDAPAAATTLVNAD